MWQMSSNMVPHGRLHQARLAWWLLMRIQDLSASMPPTVTVLCIRDNFDHET
jgi:hypothetical protein